MKISPSPRPHSRPGPSVKGSFHQENLWISARNAPLFQRLGLTGVDEFLNLKGLSVKHVVKERSTQKISLGGQDFYMKRYRVPPLRERLKLLSRLQRPHRAAAEWRAIMAFHEHGLPTVIPAAVGWKRVFGLETESFLLTEALPGSSRLDHVMKEELPLRTDRETTERRRRIIGDLARLTGRMHTLGFHHRDYYLCHIFVDPRDHLTIMDLHRVRRRSSLNPRWIVKDLAALLYSSLEVPVTSGERMAFYLQYAGKETLDSRDKALLRRVAAKCKRIARHTEKSRRRSEARCRPPLNEKSR